MRNENLPHLEVYSIPRETGEVGYDEIWIPVLAKSSDK